MTARADKGNNRDSVTHLKTKCKVKAKEKGGEL